MKPSSSERDTLVTFLARNPVTNEDDGTKSHTWAPHAQEMAQVRDMLPSRGEQIADGLSIERRPCRIRCLYRNDITSDMRVEFNDRTMEIVGGPVELGRRDGLEMVCESLSTQGDNP